MRHEPRRPAWLALETGQVFAGESLGAEGRAGGEVVFTTSMTGYVEVLTDPSFFGQIVVETYPHIGNHGIQPEDFERDAPGLSGFVVGDAARDGREPGGEGLGRFLSRRRVVAVSGLPTREITLILRETGSLRGVVATEKASRRALVAAAKAVPAMAGRALAGAVGARKAFLWKTRSWSKRRVAVLDFGVKRSLLESLREAGADVKVFPGSTKAADILKESPRGVLVSNGPGDPAALKSDIANIRELLAARVPLMGVCLGHQLLALAAGARTYKLAFGHHGANHPIREERTGRILITTQNHGFAVRPDSLPSDYVPSYVSLNDGTLEGFHHKRRPLWGYQFHPEGGPGPIESRRLLAEFVAGL